MVYRVGPRSKIACTQLMKRHQRTLSDVEKQRLRNDLPWFGRRRQERLRVIDQGIVEVYEFEIDRIWDINGCYPPCCPHTLLFRTADGSFVYIESWREIEQGNSKTNESKLKIESTPDTKTIFKTAIDGEATIRHSERLREFNEFFESGDAEWQIYNREELPEEIMTTLEAV
jgi:hypothetical protein